MVDTEITLIKPSVRTQDDEGVWRSSSAVERTILARMDDVTRAEFFAAGQNGMRSEFRFVVAPIEYEGEQICAWNGTRYAIYRTFHVPGTDDLELYVHREAGVTRGA